MAQTNAALHLIDFVIQKGFYLSVYDGEYWPILKSQDKAQVIENMLAVEEAGIKITDSNNELIGYAYVLNDLEDFENVSDYTDNDFLNEWDRQYRIDNPQYF